MATHSKTRTAVQRLRHRPSAPRPRDAPRASRSDGLPIDRFDADPMLEGQPRRALALCFAIAERFLSRGRSRPGRVPVHREGAVLLV